MDNTEAWDRIAARAGDPVAVDTVRYAPDAPTERELRLLGDVRGKRVVDLGCGDGTNAVAIARQGATHVIAIDASPAQLERGRSCADAEEVRVEWHKGDVADLAFLRADSIDVGLSTGLLNEVDDLDRLLRQVHRVLRHGSPFVFSYEHPFALCLGRDAGDAPGALPLGHLEVRRSYFDPGPTTVRRHGEQLTVWPRAIADVFASLHRAGFRVDALLEPEPLVSSDPGPSIPTTIIWRVRKEGV